MPPAIHHTRLPAPALWLAAVVAIVWFTGWRDPAGVVKLLPVAGAAAVALAFHRLLEALGTNRRLQRTAAILALPLIALDALLAGIGALQIAACVMAVAMAIERRHAAMLVWWGIAIAFTAQALLLAPFFLALAIRHRVPILWFALPATLLAVRLSGGLPELAADTASSAPNIWSLINAIAPEQAPALLGLALATALGATATYVARMQSAAPDLAGLTALAALAVLLTAGLLPHAQAQDFLLPGVLTLALTIVSGTRGSLILATLVHLGMIAAIAAGFGVGIELAAAGALCMIAATWLAAQPLIAPHANDNRDGSHAIPPPHGLRGTLSFDMIPAPAVRPRGE